MLDWEKKQSSEAQRFLRLPEIIGPKGLIPVSRSTWYAGIKDGRFPPPIKLGERVSVWRSEDIRKLIERAE